MKDDLYKILTISLVLLVGLYSCSSNKNAKIDLDQQSWIHGSEDCDTNTDVKIQIVQYDADTWILRQNRCTNYEAPFMFLFFGSTKALLMDTGAVQDANEFPLRKVVDSIINRREEQTGIQYDFVVAHTHSHGDHHAADIQFENRLNTEIVGLNSHEIAAFFGLDFLQNDTVAFELGNRELTMIPIPGHHETSIAVFDAQTKFLLTGDTFYPGRLYVNDWISFKKSIAYLSDFTRGNDVSYILGNHIEMSAKPGVDYPTGVTYQPNEQKWPLTVEDLTELNNTMDSLGTTPVKFVLDNYIISPTN